MTLISSARLFLQKGAHMATDHLFADIASADDRNEWFTKPEQALWYAVLEHALRDADHHREIVKLPKLRPRKSDTAQGWLFEVETCCERHDDLLELMAWFESEVDHVAGTFGFICNALGISDEGRRVMVRWAKQKIIQRAKLAA